jgi:hypothetical protein
MPSAAKSIGIPSFNHRISPFGLASKRHESLTGCPSRIKYTAFNGSLRRGSYPNDIIVSKKTKAYNQISIFKLDFSSEQVPYPSLTRKKTIWLTDTIALFDIPHSYVEKRRRCQYD